MSGFSIIPPRIRSVLNPDQYHGTGAKPPFFEGWYYKLVDRSGNGRFAFIPGISLAREQSKSHAFIQVLEGVSGKSWYLTFPLGAFYSQEDTFDIKIGMNRFTSEEMTIAIDDAELKASGHLVFREIKTWPVTWRSPGIMGWYGWIPFMECFHGIVSMDHKIAGTLQINGRIVNFGGGKGYTEKDWGRSFPRAYIWFQTNHFDMQGTSLTGSVAIIPWIRRPFPGFIIGFLCDGTLYKFATYNGSRILELTATDQQICWTVQNRTHQLNMIVTRPSGGILRAPTVEGMDRRIAESLESEVSLQLKELTTGSIVFEGLGQYGGLEAAGDLDQLIGMWKAGR